MSQSGAVEGQGQLTSAQLSLCLLATCAYQPSNVPSHDRGLQRLRLKAAYLLAMDEGQGPLGKHSMLGSSLGVELRRVAKSDMDDLAGTKSKLQTLSDGVLLLEPHGTTSAMRLDVDALEKAALQAVARSVSHSLQLNLTSQLSALGVPGSVSPPLPLGAASVQPLTPESTWAREAPHLSTPTASTASHDSSFSPWAEAMVAAILSVWWPHQPLMAGLALAIVGQPGHIARMRGGMDVAKLTFCTKELSRLAASTHRFLPPNTKPREFIVSEPLMVIRDDMEDWEVVQIDVHTLAQLVLNAAAGNSGDVPVGAAAAVHRAVWPPASTHTLPILHLHNVCQPLVRHVMHVLSCTEGPQARDALLSRALKQLTAIAAAPPHSPGLHNAPAGRRASPAPVRIPLARILQQAALVYGGDDPAGVLRCAATSHLASLTSEGPVGAMSMSVEDLGHVLASDQSAAWEQLPAASDATMVSKVLSLLDQLPGFLVLKFPRFTPNTDEAGGVGGGQHMDHFVQLDPAMLHDAALKAGWSGPITPVTSPPHHHGQHGSRGGTTSSNGAASSGGRYSKSGAGGAAASGLTAERIKQWAAAVFPGDHSEDTLCRMMVVILSESHDHGPFTTSGTSMGSALSRVAADAYCTQRAMNSKGKLPLQALVALSPVFSKRPKLPSDLWISLNIDELHTRASGPASSGSGARRHVEHPALLSPSTAGSGSTSQHGNGATAEHGGDEHKATSGSGGGGAGGGSLSWAGIAAKPGAAGDHHHHHPQPVASSSSSAGGFDPLDADQLYWVASQVYSASTEYRELKLHAVRVLARDGQWHKWPNKPSTGGFPGSFYLMGPQFGSGMKTQPGWAALAAPKLVKLFADDPYFSAFPHAGNAMVQLDTTALLRTAKAKGLKYADYQKATGAKAGVARGAGYGKAGGGGGDSKAASPYHPKSLRSKADAVYAVDTPHRAMKIYAIYVIAGSPGFQLAASQLGEAMSRTFKGVWEALEGPKIKNLVAHDPFLKLFSLPSNIGVALDVDALVSAEGVVPWTGSVGSSSGGSSVSGGGGGGLGNGQASVIASGGGGGGGGGGGAAGVNGEGAASGAEAARMSAYDQGMYVQGSAGYVQGTGSGGSDVQFNGGRPQDAGWLGVTAGGAAAGLNAHQELQQRLYQQAGLDLPDGGGLGTPGGVHYGSAAAPGMGISEPPGFGYGNRGTAPPGWPQHRQEQQQQQVVPGMPQWVSQPLQQHQHDPQFQYQQQHQHMTQYAPPQGMSVESSRGVTRGAPPGFSMPPANPVHVPQVQVVHVRPHVLAMPQQLMGQPPPGFMGQPLGGGVPTSSSSSSHYLSSTESLVHTVNPSRLSGLGGPFGQGLRTEVVGEMSEEEEEGLGEDAEARVRLILEVSEDALSCDGDAAGATAAVAAGDEGAGALKARLQTVAPAEEQQEQEQGNGRHAGGDGGGGEASGSKWDGTEGDDLMDLLLG